MIFLSETLDEHIVYIDPNRLPYHVLEHFGDHSLIGCSYIFQIKWHHLVAICPSWCDEGRLVLIGGIHWNLMIALKCIQKTQPRISRSRIY
jgi:hypothetical protein